MLTELLLSSPTTPLPSGGTHAPAFTLMDATSLLPQPMAWSEG